MASPDGFASCVYALEPGVHKFTGTFHIKATINKTKAIIICGCMLASFNCCSFVRDIHMSFVATDSSTPVTSGCKSRMG